MTRYLVVSGSVLFALLGGLPTHAQIQVNPRAQASDFALNYKWCWQHNHALLGAGTGSTMAHDKFVDGTLRAARSADLPYIHQLWDKCQLRQSAHGSISGLTSAEKIKAVRHVIACFSPVYGAGKLTEGQPATREGQSIGIKTCGSISEMSDQPL